MGIKIAYQNVGGSAENANVFLEWCGEEKIDIGFIGEKWRDTSNNTQFRQGMECVSKQGRVAVFVTYELKNAVKRVYEDDRVVIVEVGGKRVAGVYADAGGNRETMDAWLESWEDRITEGVMIGDWNAHDKEWDSHRQDAKGRGLSEWIKGKGFQLQDPDDDTFMREREGKVITSTIDLVFTQGVNWTPGESEMITSDHKVIWGEMECEENREEAKRVIVDWTKFLGDMEQIRDEWEPKEQVRWYRDLEGDTAYEKLTSLRAQYLKESRITAKSKKWWSLDLSNQLKLVRGCARGGKGRGSKEVDQARWKRWKNERRKLSQMIKKSKEETWIKFLEENGEKNPWDVVRLAKNPWGRQGQGMGTLQDDDGNIWEQEQDKVRIISERNFGWDPGRVWEESEIGEGSQEAIKNLEGELKKALQGTSNSSAPGPDGISYRFIKAIKDTELGKNLFHQLATNLSRGHIPTDFQRSKVVMIPKPGKDHKHVKGWRPINLINCVGKLGEKVVADKLQESGSLHWEQYGGVRGRSATEAVFRQVVRAQRCLEKGGKVGWGM